MNNNQNSENIVISEVSKWYGEILGVNRITVTIKPGLTGLVGPNGSGKSTLMNLICGILQPSRGTISVCGITHKDKYGLNDIIGYVHQFDEVYNHITALSYITSLLKIDGLDHEQAQEKAVDAIKKVKMENSMHAKLGSFSKGMKQRIKIARAIARDPRVLILDEPMAGLDPVSRKELSDLFFECADRGIIVLISSHILAEVENLTRKIIMLENGSIIAEGDLDDVRKEMKSIPMQIYLRTTNPEQLTSLLFDKQLIKAATVNADRKGVTIKTDDSDTFLREMNKLAMDPQFSIDFVATMDDSMESIYQYLIHPGLGEL